MAKQLNFNLTFNADVSQAQTNLQNLKTTLNSIASITPFKAANSDLNSAIASAQALQRHLTNAFNVKTGNLDLSKLSTSLTKSNTNLQTLSMNLLKAGTSGEQAFLQLQRSLSNANLQLVKSNSLLSQFGTSLMNTARWQVSSMVLHGFLTSIRQAIDYAEELNTSLNNIRIVTGYSSDEMAKFAKEANSAAKILSTTTTAYTDAALIFYQQGLSGEDVSKRAEITLKLANVTKQSAEVVSDQMTAIWNNFYNGTETLESFADKLTALGAATASSTDEIAGGLEKFAGIADTIGLSYDYAAAALTTITANTRQSEEVVGTALKTIFSRLEGLKLGETLEDGTDLNKYSESLKTIGVEIKDASGNLKDADLILADLGQRWQTLARDEKVALAQSVAGIRQYNQLISLMDNWNNGDNDSFMANLQTISESGGTLNEQAYLYEQSWEAATKRVKASLETIYSELVPEDFSIGLLDGLTQIIEAITGAVKAFGGLEGIILLIVSTLLNKFTPAIGMAIQTGIDKITNLSGMLNTVKEGFITAGTIVKGAWGGVLSAIGSKGNQNMSDKGYQMMAAAANKVADHNLAAENSLQRQREITVELASQYDKASTSFKFQVSSLQEVENLSKLIKNNSSFIAKTTQETLLNELQMVNVASEKVGQVQSELDLLHEKETIQLSNVRSNVYLDNPDPKGFTLDMNQNADASQMQQRIADLTSISNLTEKLNIKIDETNNKLQLSGPALDHAKDALDPIASLAEASSKNITAMTMTSLEFKNVIDNTDFSNMNEKAEKLKNILNSNNNLTKKQKDELKTAISNFQKGNITAEQFKSKLDKMVGTSKGVGKALGLSTEELKQSVKIGEKRYSQQKKLNQSTNEYRNLLTQVKMNIQSALSSAMNIGTTIAKGLSSFSTVAMSLNMVNNAINTINDSSASFTQKLSTGAMAAVMAFRSFQIVLQGVSSAFSLLNGVSAVYKSLATANLIVTGQLTAEQGKEQLNEIASIAVKKLKAKATEEEVLASTQELLVSKLGMSQDAAAAMAKLLVAGAANTEAVAVTGEAAATAADTVVKNAGTVANIAFAASEWLVYWPMLLILAVLAIIVGVILAVVSASEKATEANKEAAEAAQATADATKEEADANKQLIKSYQEALKNLDDSIDSKQNLKDATMALASAYGIEDAAVALLAKDYQKLNKVIAEARREELKKLKQDTKTAISATVTTMQDSLTEGDGRITSDGRYTGLFDNGMTNTDERAAYQTLVGENYKYLSQENGEIRFEIDDISDDKAFYEYGKELETWLQAQREYAANNGINLGASEIFQDAQAEFSEMSEQYEKLKEYYETLSESNLEDATLQTYEVDGKTLELNSIKNQQDYLLYREQILKTYREEEGIKESDTEAWEESEKTVNSYLSSLEQVADFELNRQGFDALLSENKSKEAIESYVSSLSQDEQSLFFSMEIDEETSLENVKEYLKNAQDYANGAPIIATVKTKDDLMSSYENGNWEEFKEKYSQAGLDKTWDEFIGLTVEQQKNYLTTGTADVQASMSKTVSSLLAKKNSYETATTEYNNALALQNTLLDEFNSYSEKLQAYDPTKTTLKSGSSDTLSKMFGGTIGVMSNNATYRQVPYLTSQQYSSILQQYASGGTQSIMSSEQIASLWNAIENNNANLKKSILTEIVTSSMPDADDYGKQLMIDKLNNIPNTAEGQSMLAKLLFGLIEQAEKAEYDTRKKAYEDQLIITDEKSSAKDSAAAEITPDEELMARLNYEEQSYISEEGYDYEEYTEYLNLLKQLNPQLNDLYDNELSQEYALKLVALQNFKTNKAIQTLSDNWEDWNKIMSNSGSSILDVSEVLAELNPELQKILNLDAEQFSLLPETFAQDNWNLIQDVMNGVEGSIDTLRNKAGEEILLNVAAEKVDLNLDGQLDEAFLDLHNKIAEYDNEEFLVGVALDPAQQADFFASCNEIIGAANMTADQAQAYFAGMGYDVELEEVEAPPKETPWHIESPVLDKKATEEAGVPVFSGVKKITGTNKSGGGKTFAVKTITPNGSYGGGVGVNTTATPSSIAGADDTSSETENISDPVDITNKSDVVERYKEINDQLDDIERSMEKINKQSDRLYGASRLASMKKYGKELEKEAEALKKKDKELGKNLNEDQVHLNSVGNAAGLSFQYDDNGNIINYSGEMQKLYDGLHQAETNANADGGVTDAEQDEIDWWQRRIDKVKEAQEQYDETREEWEDNRDAIDENDYAQQDNNYEIISYELEFNIELNEEAEKTLDYYIDKMDGDFYSMAESAALMGEKMNLTTDNLAHYNTNLEQLKAAYEAGEISQADYIDGLKENKNGVIENLQALLEYDQYMREVYGETLRMANEKIDENSERLQHNTSILEHYLTLLELTGQSANYDAMGKVLKGQTKTLKSNYEVSKKQYEMNKAEADEQKARLDAIKDKNSEEYKMQEQKWKDAEELARESQDQMLSDAEAYLEAEKALYENEIDAIGKAMEKAFTNDLGFDQINTSIERAKSLQEEYLTTTNKIYETNKLINQAQQEIDKTTNLSAKRKLQAFQQETKQLQNQGKLSQFELDLQQKEYDLLLAKIALEEAQNAKSTVRLTRDSEGNFGYVYTADQEKTADAEQKVADAENALYNTQLEGANKYAENAAQLKQQYLEEWKEIWLNEELGKEEKDQRLMELDNYYHQKLQDNLDLYSVATDNNLNVVEDAWSTSLDLMSFTVDDWKKEVDTHTLDAETSFDNLSSAMDEIAEEMGVDLNSLEKNVKDITKASKDLEKETTDELIPSLQDEIDEVDDLTDAYIDNYDAIEDLIDWYEDMVEEIDIAIDSVGNMQEEIDTASSKLWGLINDYNANSYVFNDPSGGGNGSDDDDDYPTYQGTTMSVYGTNYKSESGQRLLKFSDGTFGYANQFTKINTSNWTAVTKEGAAVYSGKQVGFDSSNGISIIDLGKKVTSYDTGGYTGEWGSEGKLAALHEKELILNKEDTKNFLASLELLHNIIKMIDINTSNSLISRLDSADLKTNKSNDVLEQHVTIEAVFPNVEDRYEIEEAFMNLTNEASQYINRKNN